MFSHTWRPSAPQAAAVILHILPFRNLWPRYPKKKKTSSKHQTSGLRYECTGSSHAQRFIRVLKSLLTPGNPTPCSKSPLFDLTPKHTRIFLFAAAFFVSLAGQTEERPEVCSITPAAGALLGPLMEHSAAPDRTATAFPSPPKKKLHLASYHAQKLARLQKGINSHQTFAAAAN